MRNLELKTLKDYLSEKEIEMFSALGLGNFFDLAIEVLPFYRIAVEKIFIANTQSKAADSLRRTADALTQCKIYRRTKEFDDLIQL